MAAHQLDRKRPFGTISGDEFGRLYEQDDQFYMADGSKWVPPAPVVAQSPDAAPAESTAAKPKKGKAVHVEPLAQDAQLDAQLGAA